MAEDATRKLGQGSPSPGKASDSNAHISRAAKLAEAEGRVGDDEGRQAVADAHKDMAEAGQKLAELSQKAAPTGKDVPEYAAEDIKGIQTAISRPDQPKTQEDLRATGAQLEPAIIAKDGGSVPHGMIPSPGGPVPASASADGAVRLAQHASQMRREAAGAELDEKQLLSMGKAEIRAVAHDRGYKVGEGSVRSLTSRFLEAQARAKAEK